jgi:F-type H+-transporting ATPase subunit a
MEFIGKSAITLVAASDGHHGPSFIGLMIYVALIVLAIFLFLGQAKKGMGERVFKNPFTQRFEQLYLFIENLCVGIIGSHGRKYVPMILTFWLIIFFGNATALFFSTSPTADLSFNLGMALISIGYVQWEGMKANGAGGHFKHFAGPSLPIVLAIFVTPLIFLIEIISEVMKNLSLSLRLFGNIDGGHQAVEAMNALGADFYVPIGMFLMPIKVLTVIVQALIFCLLTCVYLSLVTHHEEDHSHDPELAAAP